MAIGTYKFKYYPVKDCYLSEDCQESHEVKGSSVVDAAERLMAGKTGDNPAHVFFDGSGSLVFVYDSDDLEAIYIVRLAF